MNRGRGKHLCRIRKQNQQWLSVAGEPDSGIPVREAGEDVNSVIRHCTHETVLTMLQCLSFYLNVIDHGPKRQNYGLDIA